MEKNEKTNQKVSELFSKVSDFGKKTAENVSDFGKKTAETVQKGAKAFSKKVKEDSHERKIEREMKKYTPLFVEELSGGSFNVPNMIKIIDDSDGRDIEICEGAIGWRENIGKIEVLCLYAEAVEICNIKFIPKIARNTFYCVDDFDNSRFIKADEIFSRAHNDRLAELEHIAYCIGAKKYTIDTIDASAENASIGAKENVDVGVGGKNGNVSAQFSKNQGKGNQSSGHVEMCFEENNELRRPDLKWFKYDEHIIGLIEMRLSGKAKIKTRNIVLEGSSSATMSQSYAIAIDAAIKKLGGSLATSMEKQSSKEHYSRLIFNLEF